MILSKVESLYRQDLLKCQKDTIELQTYILEMALAAKDRTVYLETYQSLQTVVDEYTRLLSQPIPASQKHYWEVLSKLPSQNKRSVHSSKKQKSSGVVKVIPCFD